MMLSKLNIFKFGNKKIQMCFRVVVFLFFFFFGRKQFLVECNAVRHLSNQVTNKNEDRSLTSVQSLWGRTQKNQKQPPVMD